MQIRIVLGHMRSCGANLQVKFRKLPTKWGSDTLGHCDGVKNINLFVTNRFISVLEFFGNRIRRAAITRGDLGGA